MLTKFDLFVIGKVREIRKSKKISQLELAEGIGVTSGFIGKIESASTNARYNLQHINLIAHFLKISPKDLLPEKPIL